MSTTLTAADARVDTLAAVDARLAEFFFDSAALVARHGPLFGRLWAEVHRSTLGGKRFRPALVIDVHRALGGQDEDAAITAGTAFELLHTAFLLHDDVIDGDLVRRGRPNLIGEFARQARSRGVDDEGACEWARSAAILAGDLLLLSAQNLIARLDLDAKRRPRLLELLEEAVFVTAAGELHDVAFGAGVAEPRFDEVLAMSEWKTAHYSFQAPLAAGAILAGASESTISTLGEYGRRVGIAFQLRDDLLGVFGAESVTGKSTVSDLKGAKMTALAAYAMDSPWGPALRSAFAAHDAAAALEILNGCGARSSVEELIDDRIQGARDILERSDLPQPLQAYLAEVASRAARRAS